MVKYKLGECFNIEKRNAKIKQFNLESQSEDRYTIQAFNIQLNRNETQYCLIDDNNNEFILGEWKLDEIRSGIKDKDSNNINLDKCSDIERNIFYLQNSICDLTLLFSDYDKLQNEISKSILKDKIIYFYDKTKEKLDDLKSLL